MAKKSIIDEKSPFDGMFGSTPTTIKNNVSEEQEERNKAVTIYLNEKLHKRLKYHCLNHDISLNKFFNSILEKHIDEID